MKTFFKLLFFILLSIPLHAADYYWIGGSGNWSDISHWATTSGGFVTHNQAPTADDNVFFDEHSFTEVGQTVTLNRDIAFCRDMIWQLGTQNASFVATAIATLNVFGSFQLSNEMVFDFQGDVLFQGTNTGNTIDLAGHQFNRNLIFDGVGASWQFASEIVVDSLFRFFNGRLNSASFPIVAERFFGEVSSAGSNLNLENSVFTLTGIDLAASREDSHTFFLGGSAENAYDLNAASIIINGTQSTVVLNYFVQIRIGRLSFTSEFGESVLQAYSNMTPAFGTLEFQNNGTIETAIEVDSLRLGGGKVFDFASGQEYSIGFIEAQGNCEEPLILQSADYGEPIFFRTVGADLTLEYVAIRDIHTLGTGTYIADNSVDLGNNDGWIINSKPYTELYWVGGTGMWDDINHWSFTSGGPGGACIPTPGEDVIFDANSFSGPMDMVMVNVENTYCKDMRWENPTGNPIFNGLATNNIRIFGSLALSKDMDFDFKGSLFFESKDLNQTITTANHTFAEDITFNGTGSWILQDSLKIVQDLYFLSGNLNTNDQYVALRRFEGIASTQRTLNLTSSYFFLTDTIQNQFLWWEIGTDNLNLDAGTSTIHFYTRGRLTINGQNSANFHKVVHSGAGGQNNLTNREQNAILGIDTLILFAWNNTNGHVYPKNITMYPGYFFTIQSQDTLSFDSISIVGGCGEYAEIRSSITSVAAYLNPSQSNIANSLIARDLHNVTSFNIDVPGGVDLGNNIGLTFTENAGRDLYWVNDGGNWQDSTHWSLSSGGPGGECPPGPKDNVYFDANSFLNPDQKVSANPVTYCKNMDWTGATGQPRFYFFEHQNFGFLQFIDDLIVDMANTMRYRTDSMNISIDTKGKYFLRSVFDGQGSWSLQDALDVRFFEFVTGDLTTNGVDIRSRQTLFYSENKKNLDMRGSYWYHIGEGQRSNEWSVARNTMEMILAEGSTVELMGLKPVVKIFDHFTFDHLLSSNIAGKTTFNISNDQNDSLLYETLELRNNTVFGGDMYGDTILFSAGKSYELDPDAVLYGEQYIQMVGNNCTPIELKSKKSGRQADLVTDRGIVKANFVQMQDIRAIGNVDFYAGLNSTDISNNTNWIFDAAEAFINEGFLGQDKVFCDASASILDANNFNPEETYLWHDGSTDSTFVIDQPGLFFVEVTFANNCSIQDSVRVLPQQDFQPNIPDTTTVLCVGDTLLLDASLDLVGIKYLWQDSSTAASFIVRESGTYKVTLELSGCTSTDSTIVEELAYPIFSLDNDVTLCPDSTLLLDVTTDTATYRWSDGSTDPTFLVATPGVFWADVSFAHCTTRDSIEITYFDPIPLDLGADTTICEESTLTIAGNVPGATFTWSDGSTDAFLMVDAAGDYRVEAVLNGCPANDTINVSIQELPRFELGSDTLLCEGEILTLDGTVAMLGVLYTWNDGTTNPTLTIGAPGTYNLSTELNGCSFSDEVAVDYGIIPSDLLGIDQVRCEGEVINFNLNVPNATYRWTNRVIGPNFIIKEAGTYGVQVNIEHCIGGDTINVSYNPLPRFDLGNDTLLCEGEQLGLNTTGVFADSYLWQDGSTNATFQVRFPGSYQVTATLDGCSFSDAINVDYQINRTFSLGPDTTICAEVPILLNINQPADQIRWQDGSSGRTLWVSEAGTYSVEVIDGVCSFIDEIIVDTRDCFRFRMFRPSAFSPNNDGINDEFLVDVPPNTIIESFDMKIYDRWGNLLFTSGDINTGWNGFIRDQPADTGVYIYSIKVKYQDNFRIEEEIISGDVLLIR